MIRYENNRSHAFLDLFEKGIIPIEEQDIRQTRQFLSEKCDILRKEHAGPGGEGTATMSLQMRICSDLLLLSEDLEKIYRLIQKQGVVANYLMILGTFSRVIEDARKSPISDLYDLDSDIIESLAAPLAEIIRLRPGMNRTGVRCSVSWFPSLPGSTMSIPNRNSTWILSCLSDPAWSPVLTGMCQPGRSMRYCNHIMKNVNLRSSRRS